MLRTFARPIRAAYNAVGSILMISAAGLTAAGCSSLESSGAYDYDETCPESGLVTIVDFDLSASGRDEQVLAERLDDAQIEVERTGDCGGRFIAGAHSNSSAATVTLVDVPLDPEGHTEIARDRKLEALVTSTMADLRAELSSAMDRLPAEGSDLTAAFTYVGDQAKGIAGDDVAIEATVYTDGISNVGPLAINDPDVTTDQAVQQATTAPVPVVPNVTWLQVEGIGHVAGSNQPPTDYVDVVRAQVVAYLERTDIPHRDVFTTVVGR